MSSSGSRKAAFVDRDGVINEEHGFVHRIEDFVFVPGAVEAMQSLQAAGYALVVITNQSGIARGLYPESDYLRLTDHMRALLSREGVSIAAVNYCPHLPDAPLEAYRLDCDCRKPRPGLITRAIAEHCIDPDSSILIGDRATDVAAGRAAGVRRCYLVRSGMPLSTQDVALADAVYADIGACTRDLLEMSFG